MPSNYPKAKYKAAGAEAGDMHPYLQAERHAYVSMQVFDEAGEKLLGKEWVDHPDDIGKPPQAAPAPAAEEEKPKVEEEKPKAKVAK